MARKNFSGSWRGVVGIIKPTYRPGSLEEFIRLLPEGIGVIPKFVDVREGLEREFVDGFALAEKFIAELAEMKVDLIHPEGAPLFVQKGYQRSEEIVRELEEKYSIPVVTTGMVLVEAARALAVPGDRLVLGPAADGGYYLIGLKHPHRRLFEDIAWSTEHVFRQTLERAAELGLDTVTLPGWYDVDDVASLRRLAGELRDPDPARYAAPHTAAFLRRLVVDRLIGEL